MWIEVDQMQEIMVLSMATTEWWIQVPKTYQGLLEEARGGKKASGKDLHNGIYQNFMEYSCIIKPPHWRTEKWRVTI